MGAALVQLFLCLVAGFALWRLWRAFDGEDRFVRGIIVLGFLFRAGAGIVLFWISWLRLPVARSLQLGDGLWFFAQDATLYMPNAAAAARGGFLAILLFNRTVASVTYVQTLGLFALLFGIVVSVALLLNLFCYLGSCLILVRLRSATPAAKVPGTVAIAAISLSPSAMLWALQPLKDTFFQFLIIAFIAACMMWQRGWRSQPRPALLIGAAAVMFASLFAMGGIRWYFAFSVLCATFAFLILMGAIAEKRAFALAAGAIVFVALTQAFLYGAGPYAPPRLQDLFSFSSSGAARVAAMAPSSFLRDLRQTRRSFERAGGTTSIGVGGALSRLETQPPPPQRHEPRHEPARAGAQAETRQPPPSNPSPPAESGAPRQTASGTPPPPQSPTPAESPRTETVASTATAAEPVRPAPAQHASAPPPPPPAQQHHAPSTPAPAAAESHAPPPATPPVTATVHPATATAPPPAPKPVPAKPKEEPAPAQVTVRRPAPAPATATAPAPAPVVKATPPPPVVPVVPVQPERQIVLPESTTVRLATGAVAMLVPRTIAVSQGLVDIRGGRGLLWFTDIDTIAFDIVVLFALAFLLRRFRWATLRNPSFWFVGFVVVLVGLPLMYTITNFGTLFRLRMMIYTAAAMMPLSLAMAVRGREDSATVAETAADEEPASEPASLPEPQA